jgi:repressor LexA
MVAELTARQREILQFIGEFVRANGMPPTVREIGAEFGISSAGVFGHLKALERKGYLKRGGMGARSLTLTTGDCSPPANARQVPMVGRIVAGTPVLAVENSDGTVAVDESMLGRGDGEHYALRVKGDSMVDDGIFDGDTVIVEKAETARNGQIVVALVDDEATLKRFYREKGRFRLQPANSRMEPIYTDRVLIQGIVRGVMRKL